MCGIVGFVGPPDPPALRRMRDALAHRGPDAFGEFVDGRIHFGHRRLAIVDLTHGAQPMSDPNGELTVVYNGELYNHADLRPQLADAGWNFRSASDTETVLAAYRVWGSDCVKRFVGMFAFVVYDRTRQLLFGARDPMGEKPLDYALDVGDVEFAFASEAKALAEHPSLKPAFGLSADAVRSFLLHDYTTGTQTIHAGIKRLGAGCAFEFGLDGSAKPGFREWPYWRLDFEPESSNGERFVDLLQTGVRRQLMSDVPLGVFLSGGVDSSTLAALLAQMKPPEEIAAFSIGFDDPSFDETQYSCAVARHLGLTHYHRTFSAADLLARLPKLAAHLDEPFADPSILPVSLLSEFARERVTVALGGDGGDELLAGYDPFRALAPARHARRWLRGPAGAAARAGSRWLPTSDRNMGIGFRVARFLQGLEAPARLQSAAWMGPFHLGSLARVFPDLAAGVRWEDAYAPELAAEGLSTDLDEALDFFQRIYLPDDILVKVDRAAMMHSLEVRCPFLDAELVAYANRLPGELKLAGGRTKVLLKRELDARKLLPPEIVHRKKKGFGIPVARWLKRELKTAFETRVLHDWPTDLPPFNSKSVEELWRRHLAGAANNYKELWALLMLAWWRQAR